MLVRLHPSNSALPYAVYLQPSAGSSISWWINPSFRMFHVTNITGCWNNTSRLCRHWLPIFVSTILHAQEMNNWTDQSVSIIYTVTCASFVPIVYFFFPETAGRSLEEIDAIFTNSKSIFDTVRVARNMPRMHLTELAQGEKGLSGSVQSGHTSFVEHAQPEVVWGVFLFEYRENHSYLYLYLG